MEYKNKTEENVYKQIINSGLKTCQKISDVNLLSFQRTKTGNYAVFYNNICLGLFMGKDYINEKELKEIGWLLKKGTFGTN